MPLQSAHVFASHIGHTGKTTLAFQMSCFYAKRHPEIQVLVMDLAEEGDLTKRMLGGVDAAGKKVDELFGGVFRLLGDADRKSSGLTSWLWSADIDITAHAVRVREHNPNLPSNLLLVSSGAWPRDEQPMEQDKRRTVSDKIRASLERSKETWKLFCDTDGDRRPSPFTLIGYQLCSQAIIPLHLNKGDLDRTETMLGVIHELRTTGEINTQVLMIVWNFVKSQKDEPMKHGSLEMPFTPSKVSLDILDACSRRVWRVSQELPGVFVHGAASQEDFTANTMCVLRQLADNVLKPAEELGMPFVEMVDQLAASGKKQMKFRSGPDGVEYSANGDVIHAVDDAVRFIEEKFEAMALTR